MKRLTKLIVGYPHGKPGRTMDEALKSDSHCRGEFEATGLVERLFYFENSQEQGQLIDISHVAEILVLNGGYGISCEFCTNKSCDSQVSGLVCLNGIKTYLLQELSRFQQTAESAGNTSQNTAE